MGDEYATIEKRGSEIFEWYKGVLLKERLLYSEVIELLLESIRPLEGYRKDAVYDELSLLTQKPASKVLESLQESTYRLYQSMMATRYRNPRAMGM